jgi:glucose-6-phosphate isomerase
VMATPIVRELETGEIGAHDSSTAGLLAELLRLRGG